jgi:two-component system heavy metal sensor histidine kinase CusS
LSNLLSNAIRYATPKSEIQMVAEINSSEATVQVENFGEQIPPERQSQIFDRFYRSDASRSDAHLHHGLGLSIVAAIARMHGGRTFVQSTSQKTVIGLTLRIPAREVAHPENSVQRTLAYNIKEE